MSCFTTQHCADGRIRARDILIICVALYQLSYCATFFSILFVRSCTLEFHARIEKFPSGGGGWGGTVLIFFFKKIYLFRVISQRARTFLEKQFEGIQLLPPTCNFPGGPGPMSPTLEAPMSFLVLGFVL